MTEQRRHNEQIVEEQRREKVLNERRKLADRRAPYDYTATHDNINRLIAAERDTAQRDKLMKDVDHMFDELRENRTKMVSLNVLTERVEWLVYAVRGMLIAGLTGVAGVAVALVTFLMRSH